MESERKLPGWILKICGLTTSVSIIISILGIYLHLRNYRKPFEQRLIIRILIVVPLFAISCYLALLDSPLGLVLEPIREIYEAFVIYTFYKLLVLMLGGERRIILMTVNKSLTSHPFPNSLFLRSVNISDPQHFLRIKRCILQYVWMKPLLYLIISLTTLMGVYDINDISVKSIFVWLGILYNLSVTLSLYSLAMFWKCLYAELAVYNPWRKFLCVKLIIFASYWQGLAIGLLSWLGVFKTPEEIVTLEANKHSNLGIQIQNGLLCFEIIFFAWLHWNSFPYTDFVSDRFPDAAKMKLSFAMRDWVHIGDLVHDLKITTMYGDNYNLRNYDSLSDSKVYDNSDTFNQKIYQGLRVSADGKKYWIDTKDYHKTSDAKEASTIFNRNLQDRIVTKPSIHIENQAKLLKLGSLFQQESTAPSFRTPLLNNETGSMNRKTYLSDLDDLVSSDNEGLLFDDSDLLSPGNPPTSEFNSDLAKDEKLYQYVKSHILSEEQIHYPVEYEPNLFNYSARIHKIRQSMQLP